MRFFIYFENLFWWNDIDRKYNQTLDITWITNGGNVNIGDLHQTFFICDKF